MNNPGPSKTGPSGTANDAERRQPVPQRSVAQTKTVAPNNTGVVTAGRAPVPVQAAQARGPGARLTGAGPNQTGGAPTAATTASAATARAQVPPAQVSQALPPVLTRPGIPLDILHDLSFSLYEALSGTAYVVVGGVALNLLGSTRPTSEVDLFVPDWQSRDVLKKLGAYNPGGKIGPFSAKLGVAYAFYNGLDGKKYKVTIWEPRQIHLPFPKASDVVLTEFKARIPKPALLLNYKCFRWAQSEECGDEKSQVRDARDILFLLGHMVQKKLKTTRQEVDHASTEFFDEFFKYTPREKAEALFKNVGLETGV